MSASPTPAAVLWDMDGTLIDSEPYWMAAEGPLVAQFGGTWTHEQALELVGLGLEDAARILQRAGVDLEPAEIVARLSASVTDSMRTHGVPFRPGARELLAELRDAGIPTALVTMSYHGMARAVVDLMDFDAFDLIVAGDDVARPKPFPDPYLQASSLLGVDVTRTVAIEDSPNGLRSAVAAGTVAIGVPNILALDDLGANEVWQTLAGRGAPDVFAAFADHRPGVTA